MLVARVKALGSSDQWYQKPCPLLRFLKLRFSLWFWTTFLLLVLSLLLKTSWCFCERLHLSFLLKSARVSVVGCCFPILIFSPFPFSNRTSSPELQGCKGPQGWNLKSPAYFTARHGHVTKLPSRKHEQKSCI